LRKVSGTVRADPEEALKRQDREKREQDLAFVGHESQKLGTSFTTVKLRDLLSQSA
jgi:hypothetical protein